MPLPKRTIVNYSVKILYYRTLIYYGKTMVLWKKRWYYGKNYGYIPKTMELCFTMEKKYGNMEKTMVL